MKHFIPCMVLITSLALLFVVIRPLPVHAQREPALSHGPPVSPWLAQGVAGQAHAAPRTSIFQPVQPQPTAERERAVPDLCEPNDLPSQACPLPLDRVSGPFTIVPEHDQDFYQLDLPQEAAIQTVVMVRSTPKLDLVLAAQQGETIIATGTFSLTLEPSIHGPVILRVENRDPRPADGEQYRIEVRRSIVAPLRPDPAQQSRSAPDLLENNWSFETARAIAPGLVYDLSFVCPDPHPDACPAGDHDYLFAPVKAGVTYLIATFDLDPGVDTVIELFWGSTTTAIAGNDDVGPGGTLSALTWIAPDDGLLGIRIAPRHGGLAQQLPVSKTGYRFAVAPSASELARKLEEVIRKQANQPSAAQRTTQTPTANAPSDQEAAASTGTSQASLHPTSSSVPEESIAAGPALILHESFLRREPHDQATILATLPAETQVSVRGQVRGLWVSIETDASILPGWVRWSDLQRISPVTAPTATAQIAARESVPAGDANQDAGLPVSNDQPAQGVNQTASSGTPSPSRSTANVTVTTLDPALPALPPAPIARIPFSLAVTLAATNHLPSKPSTLGMATPTPNLSQPVPQVRVQLINVFGDVLAEGLTDAQGLVTFRRDVQPGHQLYVRMPAWGVEVPLAPQQSQLIVTIPEGRP